MKITKLNAMVVFILALITFSVSSFAQDKDSKTTKSPEERARITTDKMKSNLNLSEEQSSKIYDANLQRIKDHRDYKENKSKLNRERKKKSTEYKNSLKNTLTDEQFNKMKKLNKDKKYKKAKKNKRNKQ